MSKYNFGKILSQTFREQARYVNNKLGHLGLSYRTFIFLMDIVDHQRTTPKELANRLYTDKTRTAKAIASLEKLEFIRCETDKNDKRVRILKLSDQGQNKVLEVKQVLQDMNQLILSEFSQAELAKTFEILNLYRKKLTQSMASNND